MLKTTSLLMLGFILASACSTGPTGQQIENQQKSQKLAIKDQQIRDLRSALESIELRVDEISQEFPLARVQPEALPVSAQRIFRGLGELEEEIDQTRGTLFNLEQTNFELEQHLRISELWVDTLENRLERHSTNLAQIEDALRGKSNRVQALKQERAELMGVRDSLILEKNLAWFTYGSPSQLKAHGVIHKKGDFLGIGGRWELTPDARKEFYQPVDKRLISKIPVESEKVEVVSDHPVDSYAWEYREESTVLHILDPDSFWSFSKCLAMVAR